MIDTQALRKKILDAAIRGKLTEQLPEDGNAEDLYKEIQAEKLKLIKEGKIKKEKPLPEISDDDIKFDIPENWKWVRVGKAFSVYGGKRIPVGQNLVNYDTGHKYIRVVDMKDGSISSIDTKCITDTVYQKIKQYTISKDDVYITVAGTIGRVGLIPEEFDNANLTENADKICVYRTNKRFVFYMLSSPQVQMQISEMVTQVGQPKLAIVRIQKMAIPLPPLAEQNRIVSKLDSLFARLDLIDEQQKKLSDNAQALRNKLIELGISGKLIEQPPEDGNAEDLYKAIQDEKQKLIKEGKIKEEKPLPEIAEKEIPFDIPENWKWVRLRSIVYNRGQITPRERFSYIDIGSIDNKHQRLNFSETIIEADKAPSRARKMVCRGDVLYSTVRPYLHNMCIVDRDFSCTPIASTGFAVMACHEGINNRFLFFYLLSPAFDAYANDTSNSKGVAYPAINDDSLYQAVVPLPPIAEQKRIVEKLDQLLPLCDAMRADISGGVGA